MPARMRIANAPVSFGVDEILVDDAWMADPDAILDIMVELEFDGTELGPPGYLGTADQVREMLAGSLRGVGSSSSRGVTGRAGGCSSGAKKRSRSARVRTPTTAPSRKTASLLMRCAFISADADDKLTAVSARVGDGD